MLFSFYFLFELYIKIMSENHLGRFINTRLIERFMHFETT